MKSFGTGIPWNDLMHHNIVLTRDTHADPALVLEDVRSVNPYVHHRLCRRCNVQRWGRQGESRERKRAQKDN